MLPFVTNFCRFPSNISDPMGDHMPPPNAWRPMHPPNMGPSFNGGFHGMGPPLVPRSGDMALPINAVSINLMMLNFFYPKSNVSILYLKATPELLIPFVFLLKCCASEF